MASFIAFDIRDRFHTVITQAVPNPRPFIPGKTGEINLIVEVALPPLIPGLYFIDAWIGSSHDSTLDYVFDILSFDISEGPMANRTFPYTTEHGAIVTESRLVLFEDAIGNAAG